MSYANNTNHVNNMSYVGYMRLYVWRLYELYVLSKSYRYFYESLKIIFFVFVKLGILLLIYKDGKPKL